MKMEKSFCAEKGFTFAELLIVIVILGILGGIAFPRFYPQQEKAHVAEAVNILGAIRLGEKAYFMEHNAYLAIGDGSGSNCDTTNWRKIGMECPNGPNGEKRFFNYWVDLGDPGYFSAIATRCSDMSDGCVDGGTLYGDKTIPLNNQGKWLDTDGKKGTHPLGPS